MSLAAAPLLALSAALCAAQPLKNVIITSFGEMPYEPAENGGFYQSAVIPVSLNGKDEPQTMDVALRTGILVEDPNEKTKETNDPEPIEEKTVNMKRQTARNHEFLLDEEDFLIPKSKVQRNSRVYPTVPSFGYSFQQTIPQKPFTPRTDYNRHQEDYGELGFGWDLQDAEELLQGRNYNVLVRSDHYSPLPPRETPPPAGRHFPDYSMFGHASRRSWPSPYLPVYYGDSDDYLAGI